MRGAKVAIIAAEFAVGKGAVISRESPLPPPRSSPTAFPTPKRVVEESESLSPSKKLMGSADLVLEARRRCPRVRSPPSKSGMEVRFEMREVPIEMREVPIEMREVPSR